MIHEKAERCFFVLKKSMNYFCASLYVKNYRTYFPLLKTAKLTFLEIIVAADAKNLGQ